MKFLLSFSFLLFAAASSINASSFFIGRGGEVLDNTGAQLQFGVPYYMLTAMTRWGAGVCLEGKMPCPKEIRVCANKTDKGTPVVFSPSKTPAVFSREDQNGPGIYIWTPLIISFYNLTRPTDEVCSGSNSTIWTVPSSFEYGSVDVVVGAHGDSVFELHLAPWPVTFLLYQLSAAVEDYDFGVHQSSRNLVKTRRGWGIPLRVRFQKKKAPRRRMKMINR